jgi:acyl-CoA synthetase (AMP-forming)/AMP-acid ligase II
VLVSELIRRGARRWRDQVAVVCGDERLTFSEVDERSNRFAHALAAAGVERGERVGLLLGNSLVAVPVDFACTKGGFVRVPLNTRLAAPEQGTMLRSARVRTLVHSLAERDRAAELASSLAGLRTLEIETELAEAAARAPAGQPEVDLAPDDELLLVYTSGTTGRLKAVRHTQASAAAITANILANLLDPRPGDVMLHAASLIHASGTFVLPFWLRGGTAALLPSFRPDEFLAELERVRATCTNLVPTMLAALLASPRLPETDLSSLRTIVYGASPTPRPLLEHALDVFGERLVQYYGQTEAPLCISVLRPEDHTGDRLGSCGRPVVEAEVRLDPESGEVLVRAPFTAAGYDGDPQLDAETFLPGGWVRTRDVGRFDDEGFLHLVDRTSDMIVTGGYNVYPSEVESVLCGHPAVRQAVVVGAPDERWMEAVTAFVVADGVEADDLLALCRERLAGYKVPKEVRFVDEIPKSPVGKLLRRALRDPLWEGHERSI